jgi:hypothetical protein
MRGIQTGFSAPERIDDKFEQRRTQARTRLEGDHLLPGLADSLTGVRGQMERLDALAVQPGPDAAEVIRDSLQNVGYMEEIADLSGLASDNGDFDRLSVEAGRWGRDEPWV